MNICDLTNLTKYVVLFRRNTTVKCIIAGVLHNAVRVGWEVWCAACLLHGSVWLEFLSSSSLHATSLAPDPEEADDVMELVPNIILNPGFVESQTIIGTAPCAVLVRGTKYANTNGTAAPRKVWFPGPLWSSGLQMELYFFPNNIFIKTYLRWKKMQSFFYNGACKHMRTSPDAGEVDRRAPSVLPFTLLPS